MVGKPDLEAWRIFQGLPFILCPGIYSGDCLHIQKNHEQPTHISETNYGFGRTLGPVAKRVFNP